VREHAVWHNYHVYYSDLNRLILDCVHPLLESYKEQLDMWFWERHYAGGPHLRVRMRGKEEDLNRASRDVEDQIKRYLICNPSRPILTYSPAHAKLMLAIEEEEIGAEDLAYHVNQIKPYPYQRLQHHLASDDAADLLEHFLHDSMPMVLLILKSHRPVKEELMRLYFAHAVLVTGEMPRGCVAYKSHWEGFAAFMPVRQVVSRIQEQYLRSRERVDDLMQEVLDHYREKRMDRDPILGAWQALASEYKARTLAILSQEHQVTRQPTSVEEVRGARGRVMEAMVEDSPFVRALFRDERFMASIQFHQDFLWPRVLTNFLYQVVSAAGLPMLEKMSLCYCAHRAAEDRWHCDLTDFLEETMESVIQRHGQRLET
jgi:Lantibiotic biosynthesis dehydratase C-term